MNINQQIPNIKKKINELKLKDSDCENFGADTHQYKLNPAIKGNIIETFERVHSICLPESYRLFITNIGDGGAGPCYGLYSFQKAIELSVDADAGVWLADEFPLTNQDVDNYFQHCQQCEDEGETDLIKKITMPDPLPNMLCLAEYGCNCFYILVVNGEQKDTVWLIDGDNNTISPVLNEYKKQRTFIDWYGSWLDHHLNDISYDKKLDETTKTANYDGRKLNAIPKELIECSNLRSLIFSRNELKKYPEEINCFKELRTLDLSMNPLKSLSTSIGNLTKLKRLLINYSDISELPDELANLQELEELSSYYNYKMKKAPEIINKLIKLKKLKLSNCSELKEIPSIENLQELVSLDLTSSSKIKKLPETISKLSKLKYLYLGGTGISKLPADFGKIITLTNLEIDADQLDLEDAVEKIKYLPNLGYLCICNQLTYPENFSSLHTIKHLRVTQNYDLWRKGIETFVVPEEISLVPNLEILEFDSQNDQATELPENIGNLIYLKELYLPRVSRFPESIRNLHQLNLIQGYKENLSEEEINKLKSWHPHCEIQIW